MTEFVSEPAAVAAVYATRRRLTIAGRKFHSDLKRALTAVRAPANQLSPYLLMLSVAVGAGLWSLQVTLFAQCSCESSLSAARSVTGMGYGMKRDQREYGPTGSEWRRRSRSVSEH